ncbi:hypothetical protein [Campylobacter volucris]|uniref:hypothetical protein n=1 Tax=Campylobacter volucris TaxID=1031542 RepID=UPI00189D8F4D|nr:hypothetical protein [Campylobacter volucris]MBF7068546.1 hypothetical protein [Campylobacter volucris]
MSYKKFIFLSILIPLPIIFALGILLYVYDPLRLYHKPWFRDDTYYSDIRLQAKSIIDNNDFDSVIIGSSMLENTSAKEASEKLNANFVNLSAGGSVFKERTIILNYLLKSKNIKNVIYSLDGYSLVNLDNNRTFNHYDYLYDDNLFNDFKIYINKKFIFCALVFSKSQKCVGEINDLENLTSWYKEHLSYFGDINKWNNKSQIRLKTALLDINKEKCKDINIPIIKNALNENIFNLIKDNKNTNFYLIIPTYSRLYHALNYNNYCFNEWKKILTIIIQESQKYPNVKIYGFDDLDYADDIANYKDLEHYNVDMNEMQLDAIKNNTHILTIENINEYFKIMEEKIISYDLQPIIEKINKNK